MARRARVGKIFRANFRTDRRVRFGDQSGSGTVLAFGAVALATSVFCVSQLLAFNLIQHRRLQVATDAMAIAAADSLRGLNSGFPCPTAAQIGLLEGVRLDTCRIVGFEVFISAHLEGAHLYEAGLVLRASARAGPSY